MKQLAHEHYSGTDHFWMQANLMQDHDYGQVLDLGPSNRQALIQQIKADIVHYDQASGHYWYFGQAIDNIQVMVRYQDGQFISHVNVKDFDFALHTDRIDQWKQDLEQDLNQASIG